MPSRNETAYFGAGPAPLPTSVLEEASQVLLNYKDMGLGITEISHRSPEAAAILAHTKDSLRALYNIPSNYSICFLQGGGSGEFSASVYHMTALWVGRRRVELLSQGTPEEELLSKLKEEVKKMKLDYLVTGSWSLKASQEAARLIGASNVNVATDSRTFNSGKFGKIASEQDWTLTPAHKDSAMVYFCDNETVDGVEFPSFPTCLENNTDYEIVADMSSNFLSRAVDVSKYSVIFGGAQKNVGSTGITIAIIKNSLLPPQAELAKPDLLRQLGLPVGPVVLDWPTIVKNDSLYNTLPIFDVWIAGQVMQGLLDRASASDSDKKIRTQQTEAEEKAGLIYGVLDKYDSVYHVVPDKSVRSNMNICFRIGDAEKRDVLEKEFLKGATERLLLGCKGHRSVGGCRISNYNAVGMEQVQKLVAYLDEFAKKQ